MIFDEGKLYIEVVELNEIYNYVVQTFLTWDRVDVEIYNIL